MLVFFFFFKQKTAYEMRISDWSSDVCSSDLALKNARRGIKRRRQQAGRLVAGKAEHDALVARAFVLVAAFVHALRDMGRLAVEIILERKTFPVKALLLIADALDGGAHRLFNLFQRARGPAGFVVVDALAPDFAGKDHPLCRGDRKGTRLTSSH